MAVEPAKGAVALPLTIILLWPRAIAQELTTHRDGHQRNFTHGAETEFRSAYVWRGIVLDDSVALPSAWISSSGLTLAVFSGLMAGSDRALLQGTGLILTYSRDWKKLRIEPTIETYWHRRPEGFDDRMQGGLETRGRTQGAPPIASRGG